jgi:hypothetical protein
VQFLFRAPTWHPQLRRRVPPRTKTLVLAGLPFNTSTYEFGQRTGLAVADFAIFASTALNISVYALADVLLATQLFSYTESTGSNGRLTRKDHASLVAGTTYFFVARNADGSLNGCGTIQAIA